MEVGAGIRARVIRRGLGRDLIALADGREVESRRGRRPRRIAHLVFDESTERLTDASEGVNITDVGIGESVALVNRLVEEATPLAAERHRRKVVEL